MSMSIGENNSVYRKPERRSGVLTAIWIKSAILSCRLVFAAPTSNMIIRILIRAAFESAAYRFLQSKPHREALQLFVEDHRLCLLKLEWNARDSQRKLRDGETLQKESRSHTAAMAHETWAMQQRSWEISDVRLDSVPPINILSTISCIFAYADCENFMEITAQHHNNEKLLVVQPANKSQMPVLDTRSMA